MDDNKIRTWIMLTNFLVKRPNADPNDFSFPSVSCNMKGCFLVTVAVTGTEARKGFRLPIALVTGAGLGSSGLAAPLLVGFSAFFSSAADSFFSSASAAIFRWICGELMTAASTCCAGLLMVAMPIDMVEQR